MFIRVFLLEHHNHYLFWQLVKVALLMLTRASHMQDVTSAYIRTMSSSYMQTHDMRVWPHQACQEPADAMPGCCRSPESRVALATRPGSIAAPPRSWTCVCVFAMKCVCVCVCVEGGGGSEHSLVPAMCFWLSCACMHAAVCLKQD